MRGFPSLCRSSRQSDDGATCRLRELGVVRDVLIALGVALVVPNVLRVDVS